MKKTLKFRKNKTKKYFSFPYPSLFSIYSSPSLSLSHMPGYFSFFSPPIHFHSCCLRRCHVIIFFLCYLSLQSEWELPSWEIAAVQSVPVVHKQYPTRKSAPHPGHSRVELPSWCQLVGTWKGRKFPLKFFFFFLHLSNSLMHVIEIA